MANRLHKKQSKRKTCRLKFKIVRKVAEHNRKQKRKKHSSDRKPKDIGVPNSLPFKEEILREAEQRKMRAKALKTVQKESKLKRQMEGRDFVQMVQDTTNENAEFHPEVEEDTQKENVRSSKTFFKDLKAVVEEADVLLEVLDARDPLGTRCPEVEDLIIKSGKKLVLVLNKIDLIPKDNLQQWLKHLQLSLPTVAFKASTQNQASKLSQSKTAAIHISQSLQSSSRCIGASFVMKLLGNYCRNKDIQTCIKVGVVGLPNVGKSSLINSLKRSRACSVGGTPGLTRSVQEVSLTKKIKIIDCPGVVLARDSSLVDFSLRNALKVEKLRDVLTPAEAIVQRVSSKQLCLQYTVPDFASSHELFALLARRMGKFKKRGVPNIEEGARRLLNDYNRGVVKYFTNPPEKFDPAVYLSTDIVSEMSKAFDISTLDDQMQCDIIPDF